MKRSWIDPGKFERQVPIVMADPMTRAALKDLARYFEIHDWNNAGFTPTAGTALGSWRWRRGKTSVEFIGWHGEGAPEYGPGKWLIQVSALSNGQTVEKTQMDVYRHGDFSISVPKVSETHDTVSLVDLAVYKHIVLPKLVRMAKKYRQTLDALAGRRDA